MLALCTSPNEISLVLAPSDARWLSQEMSFLAELYRSKAGSSERQFGGDCNPALMFLGIGALLDCGRKRMVD